MLYWYSEQSNDIDLETVNLSLFLPYPVLTLCHSILLIV